MEEEGELLMPASSPPPLPSLASKCFALNDSESFYQGLFENRALEKILEMLKTVCNVYKLPLALTWMTHRDYDNLHFINEGRCVNDFSMLEYVKACAGTHLKKGQDVAGKAVSLMQQYSVPDVSVLDLADYPFANIAKKIGLRAAMAIRVKCKHVGKIEYVSEIFLPTNLEDKVEQNDLIDEILFVLHKNCKDSGIIELKIESLPKKQVTATEFEFSEPENPSDQILMVEFLRAAGQHPSCGGFDSNKKIIGETDEPNELEVREQNAEGEHIVDGNKQVAEMHDRQQIMSINKRKRTDTQQTKGTPKSRKTTSEVWKFFSKVKENGEVWAKCPKCSNKLAANSKNGTSNQLKHRCFKDWKKDAKQLSVSNVKSVTKVNFESKASPTGDEAAVSGPIHDQVQELTIQDDNTTEKTPGRGLKDQEHYLLSTSHTELLPTETQNSGQQANDMVIDGTGGIPQVGCNPKKLIVEDTLEDFVRFPSSFQWFSWTSVTRLLELVELELSKGPVASFKVALRSLKSPLLKLKEELSSQGPNLHSLPEVTQTLDSASSLHSQLERDLQSLRSEAFKLRARLQAVEAVIQAKEKDVQDANQTVEQMEARMETILSSSSLSSFIVSSLECLKKHFRL